MKNESYDVYSAVMKEAFPYAEITVEALPEMSAAKIKTIKTEESLSEHEELIYYLGGESYLKLCFSLKDADLKYVQIMAENILEMLHAQEKNGDAQKTKDYREGILLNNILHAESKEIRTYTTLLAAECGKSLNIERAVCVLQCEGKQSILKKAQEIIAVIKNMKEYSSQDIIGLFGDRQIVICKEVKQSELPLKLQFQDYFEHMLQRLEQKLSMKFQVGVGMTARNLDEYARNLQVILQITSSWKQEQHVKYASESLVECIAGNLDEKMLEHYLYEGVRILRENSELLPIADALVKHNMNQIAASNELYLHRNTVALHLKKMKRLLNIDPVKRDEDKFYLMLLSSYYHSIYQDM